MAVILEQEWASPEVTAWRTGGLPRAGPSGLAPGPEAREGPTSSAEVVGSGVTLAALYVTGSRGSQPALGDVPQGPPKRQSS